MVGDIVICVLLVLLLLCKEFFPILYLIPFMPVFCWVIIQLLLTNIQVIREILTTFQFFYKFLTSMILFYCFCELNPPNNNTMSTISHFMDGIFLTLNIIACFFGHLVMDGK